MTVQTIRMEPNEAFLKIKEELTKRGCKIISDNLPKQIIAKQGSIWGLSPKTAQKIVTIDLEKAEFGTKITCSSKLGSSWKNLTIIGTALSIVVVGICLWIAYDLNVFLASRQPNYWSWLISVGGAVYVQIAQSLVSTMEILAVSLSSIIVFETIIALYAQRRVNLFAEEMLRELK